MEKIIDLHIHTTFSDGGLTPKQVIDEACKNKIDTIAIADHDTIEAYNEEVYQYAKDRGIQLIPAVEISTRNHNVGIHVLGYNIDIHDQKFQEKLLSLRNSRHDYLYNVAKKLEELGYLLNMEKLDSIEAVTKAHIALDIINNPLNKDKLLKVFSHIPSKGEFIETIMNEGCPAYVEKLSITPKEAAELIHSVGGKVILAHPVAYKYEDGLTEEDILNLVKEMQADGIEGNYIYIDRNNKKINEVDFWNGFAKQNRLLSTIGSDFHNDDGVHPLIGLVGEKLSLTGDDIDRILLLLSMNSD